MASGYVVSGGRGASTAGRSIRVAWLGPVGIGGGRSLGSMLLSALVEAGAEVEVYQEDPEQNLPPSIARSQNVTVVGVDTGWEWERWYSRAPMTAFVSGLLVRSRAHSRLTRLLVEAHRRCPYDVVFQFSQFELLGLRRYLGELPPLVVHPCTHAAGELRWHRLEGPYARQSEPLTMHTITHLVLQVRTALQRRQARQPAIIVGPSARFNTLVAQDYRIPADRFAILRHPVRLDLFRVGHPSEKGPRIRLLFVSRISVRKGVELVVDLSHRLDDLADDVEIRVIGDRTQWSNYLRHLSDLNPRVASYHGPMDGDKMPGEYARADALLVPSHYEPGSLVIGEALSSGLAVVASGEVGPAEALDPTVCRVFPRGDLDAFERAARQLVAELRVTRDAYARRAREEAARLFAPSVVGLELLAILRSAARPFSADSRSTEVVDMSTNGDGPSRQSLRMRRCR